MCSAPVGGRDPVHRSSLDRGAAASRGLLAAGFSRPGGMGGWARERCAGFSFSFLHRIPPSGGNGISGEISRNFGNFDRKGILNLKNKISLHSGRNFGFVDRNFGDFDRNFGFVTVK